ncbi:hypothetical protein ACROYT_G008909 [Oculina patagonica]
MCRTRTNPSHVVLRLSRTSVKYAQEIGDDPLVLSRPVNFGKVYGCFEKRNFGPGINECASNPCLNGGTCVDQVNGYVCNCQPGYGGVHCQTNINECSSNPCLNEATCVDQVNGYVCNCQPGYTGVNCQTSSSSSWLEYTPEICGADNRIQIQWGGITEAECKQRCPDCAAIEYWSGATKTCWECVDHTKRRPYTNTEDGSYPPHVFVRI